VATINPLPLCIGKSPVLLAGFFCLCSLLSACEPPRTPEQVSQLFWQALSEGDVEAAKQLATTRSQHLISQADSRENATFNTGQIVINGDTAFVETRMMENNRTFTFETALLKEDEEWKVDYQQTQINLTSIPFSGILQGLDELGETFKKGLEQQMPLFEKQIQEFGEELKQQLDEFGRYLENPKKWKKQHPYREQTI